MSFGQVYKECLDLVNCGEKTQPECEQQQPIGRGAAAAHCVWGQQQPIGGGSRSWPGYKGEGELGSSILWAGVLNFLKR